MVINETASASPPRNLAQIKRLPEGRSAFYVEQCLTAEFRYLHEPLSERHSEDLFVGRDEQVRQFADRIAFSFGGAFLITGFRGVGKTTFVQRTLRILEQQRGDYERLVGPFRVIPVWIGLARPIEPGQLMHLLLRQLYLTLRQRNLFSSLEADVRRDLETAFLRTSFEISRSNKQQMDGSLEAKLPGATGPLGFRRMRSAEEVLRFLPYDDRAAEFDLIAFAERLSRPGPKLSLLRQLRDRLQKRHIGGDRRPPFKIVFVLDELDKLETAATSSSQSTPPSALDDILASLKTIFTTSAFSFVFIAGRELRYRWLADIALGDSIYESVFAHDIYLPCLWQEQQCLVTRSLGSRTSRQEIEDIKSYLAYVGRGIPRRILREMNQLVIWREGKPWFLVDGEKGRRVRTIAKLQAVLSELHDDPVLAGSSLEALEHDSRRLAMYYLFDWILSTAGRLFTVDHLQEAALRLNLGQQSFATIEGHFCRQIVELLVRHGLLDAVYSTAVVRDIEEAQKRKQYRLSAWVTETLARSPDSPFAKPLATDARSPTRIGEYQIVDEIGAGGFSLVYRALNRSGSLCALKLLAPRWQQDEEARQRFAREIELLGLVKHPNIVKIMDAGESEGHPYFVMELLEGMTLRSILSRLGRLAPQVAVRICRLLAGAFAAIHEMGWVRVDTKPTNIMLSTGGMLKVVDLGIAKGAAEETKGTATGALVGSFDYISPEQVRGEPSSVQSDIYSLATVLYEMLTGNLPFPDRDIYAHLYALLNFDPVRPSSLVDLDPVLESVVLRGLDRDAARRFASMEEFSKALQPLDGEADMAALVTRAQVAAASQATEQPTVGCTRRLPLRGSDSPGGATQALPSRPAGFESRPAIADLRATVAETRRQALNTLRNINPPHILDLLFDFEQGICFLTNSEMTARVLGEGRLVLGRSRGEVDLPIQDLTISRHHAAFFVAKDSVEVENLGARNGIWIAGQPIQRAPIEDGTILNLGSINLRIHIFRASDR
jgi:serine/threonine-protein kinase